MSGKIKDLSFYLKNDAVPSFGERMGIIWKLSIPGMIAQLSSILMSYIDAAMVGSLGANASASIGLVASTTWLFGGIMQACVMGGCVQVAHCVGAGDIMKAKKILFKSLVFCSLFGLFLCAIGSGIAFFLPGWLGADELIHQDAGIYFFIFSLCVPFVIIKNLSGTMLQCSGNMRVPGILNVAMCFMDVAFNFVFINLMHLGVMGAAMGTFAADVITAGLLFYFCFVKSPVLSLKGIRKSICQSQKKEWKIDSQFIYTFVRIALPMAGEQFAICSALIMITRIIAPLGSVAIAANSFAVTAESICYMPGHGISDAATTLVGQSVGAQKKKLSKHFAWETVFSGMAVMIFTGVLMYFMCPLVFKFLTPDLEVRALGIKVLRIELFAEPLFAAAIVASGALRGAGDTFAPFILNLISIWGVRIVLSLILCPVLGLVGVWIAMCVELCVRGSLLLIRLGSGKWQNKSTVKN